VNATLDFDALAAHARAALGSAVQRVGTCYDVDYWTAYLKAYPAVWFCAQRHVRGKDNGRGFTGRVRQHLESELIVRLVVQRVKPGQVSAAAALKAIYDATCAALIGYVPDGADHPLTFVSIADGPSNESLVTADLVLSTGVTFSKDVST
jgi:hypothetical protein